MPTLARAACAAPIAVILAGWGYALTLLSTAVLNAAMQVPVQ